MFSAIHMEPPRFLIRARYMEREREKFRFLVSASPRLAFTLFILPIQYSLGHLLPLTLIAPHPCYLIRLVSMLLTLPFATSLLASVLPLVYAATSDQWRGRSIYQCVYTCIHISLTLTFIHPVIDS
jgi:cellulose synthase/poly-beta-1,6-N-acetylglucosamine synthase-like glycosyltransferase